MIRFHIPGEPQGKGRPRIGKVGQHARMFTPAKTVAYEGLVAFAAEQAMAGRQPLAGPCRIELDVVCTVPASWSLKKQAMAVAGEVWPTKKPDADNVLKAVCDGINGVVWVDDAQAVIVAMRKRYGRTPGVGVVVSAVDAARQIEMPQHELEGVA
jgi:Holliday junction resolvase RusA-like endonuclease